jgi:hypothetical protein
MIEVLCYIWKVMYLSPDANEFFSIYLILPAALGPGVYSATNRDEYQKIFLR